MNLVKWLDENFERTLLSIFLILMTLVMGYQIVMRYVFNASLTWSEELTRYLFVWSSFISISYCIKNGISIKIDQLFNKLPDKLKNIVQISNKILMMVFFLYLAYHSVAVVQSAINSGQRSPALGLPMYMVQVSSTVGFVLATIRVFQSLIKTFKRTIEIN